MSIFNRFAKDESGATAIEYGLIAALVSVAIIAVLGTLGDNLKSTFQSFPTSWAVESKAIGAGRRRHLRPPMPHPIAGGTSWTSSKAEEPWADHRFPGVARRWLAQAQRLLPLTEGGTSIEYALLVGLIALVIIGALGDLGSALIALPLPALIAAFEGAGLRARPGSWRPPST